MIKRCLTALLALCLTVGCAIGGMTAFGAVSLEECDLCFQQTVNGILEEDEVNGSYIISRRTLLYDLNLEPLGYVYSFDTACGSGYAVIICDGGNYVTREFLKSTLSPYLSVGGDELCVYAQTMSYFKSVDGEICDISSSVPLSRDAVETLRSHAVFYKNGIDSSVERRTVKIQYVSHNLQQKKLCLGVPTFYNVGYTGGCAAVAGTILVGFYDRYYENLIPNHVAGGSNGDLYIYYSTVDDNVEAVMSTLYNNMGGSSAGITENGFKNGMISYCGSKNLTCEFTSLFSGGQLNYVAAKNCSDENKPLVLFLNTYTVCQQYFEETESASAYEIHYGNHVMVGFGYRHLNYTTADGTNGEQKFIYVATGWGDPRDGYFNIDYCTNIISAYKVNIY